MGYWVENQKSECAFPDTTIHSFVLQFVRTTSKAVFNVPRFWKPVLRTCISDGCNAVVLWKPDVLYTQQNKLDLKILHVLATTEVFWGQG